MSSGPELLTIFQRIGERVDHGSESFMQVNQLISKRAELEEKFIQLLSTLIPQQYDKADPLVQCFIDEVQNEIAQHQTLARTLRERVTTPANTFASTMKEKQKNLQKVLSKESSMVAKACNDSEKARHKYDEEKEKLNGLPPNKVEGQQKKIKKAAQEYQTKSQNAAQVAMKTQQSSIPNIHREFLEFDSTRLTKFQAMVMEYARLLSLEHAELVRGINILGTKMSNFDPKDRSQRYVARVFDTSLPEINDDAVLMAVAIADFRSEEPTDLQFSRGDQIQITLQHNSGWWEGELAGKRGQFPKTFIQMPGSAEIKNDPIGAVFLVKDDYEKQRGGDLSLLSGDLVYVDYVSKGRCSGTNLRDRKRGYFPVTVLETKIEAL